MASFLSGFSVRYADLSGNALDKIRGFGKPPLDVCTDVKNKLCTCCGKKKPKKGGTNPTAKGWKCADCKMKRTYFSSCVEQKGRDIIEMCETQKPITFSTFFKHVDLRKVSAMLGYQTGREKGLHLKDDWAVSYFRSFWKGKPCYFMRWSGIEMIFL